MSWPGNTLLNVNLPPLIGPHVQGVRLTRLGQRYYSGSLKPMTDPWGRTVYWIGGGSATWTGPADSDFQAVRDGFVSVTPLHLDLTHRELITDAGTWWRAPALP